VGVEVYLHSFLNSALGRCEWLTLSRNSLTSEMTSVPTNKRPCGHQRRSGGFGEKCLVLTVIGKPDDPARSLVNVLRCQQAQTRTVIIKWTRLMQSNTTQVYSDSNCATLRHVLARGWPKCRPKHVAYI
jgi:hypothetical protein